MSLEAGFEWSAGSGIGRLCLARPDDGNTVSLAMIRGLQSALAELEADPEVRVILLEAQGEDFCLGRNGEGESREGLSAYAIHQQFLTPILDLYAAIDRCGLPVVSVVQGRAFGFGCALAAACDITLAGESAQFALPEILRGIPPTLAMSTLRGRVPRKAIAYLIHSALPVDARTAREFGLVSHVVPDSRLRQQAESLLAGMANQQRIVNATVKEFVTLGPGTERALASRFAGLLMTVNRSHTAAR
ncbi:enoyl-CoA hydratase/isomerase family protein [Paraburkholderia sp. BR13439]|uniref:enoyl-CoA hydratase/isomerase family protein n=1 Tax=Paraburkholderia sp. BR13439 TaxID=3236996 RepID=UPI0034CFABC1